MPGKIFSHDPILERIRGVHTFFIENVLTLDPIKFSVMIGEMKFHLKWICNH